MAIFGHWGALMHSDVLGWVDYVLTRTEAIFNGDVLEMGSRDWNGNPRHLLPGARYIGVDLQDGPGVDLVADCADLSRFFLVGTFDVVLCLEVLEHSDKKVEILAEMFRLLRRGGIGILTAGAPGRPEHDGGTDFYENVDPVWLVALLAKRKAWGVEVGPNEVRTPDVRAWFRK